MPSEEPVDQSSFGDLSALQQLEMSLKGLPSEGEGFRFHDAKVREVFLHTLPLPGDRERYSQFDGLVINCLANAVTDSLRVGGSNDYLFIFVFH